MREEEIYSIKGPYREPMGVRGYYFGSGKKTACIVGSLRGNEIQQMYVCSQLVRELEELERRGGISQDNEILVVPVVNTYSINIEKRFWAMDGTDINRMFPGHAGGETTQRIADGIFSTVKEYSYGIQFASFYTPGDFVPHVRMMDTGHSNESLADLFGLPYAVLRKPKPIDTTTLNYNLQIWDCNAFSVYTKETDCIDEGSARQAVSAVLRFLTRMGVIRYHSHGGYLTSLVREEELRTVRADMGGIYRRQARPGDEVECGQVLAEIIHPYEGYVMSQVVAPVHGIVFFSHKKPLVTEHEIVYRLIKRMHL